MPRRCRPVHLMDPVPLPEPEPVAGCDVCAALAGQCARAHAIRDKAKVIDLNATITVPYGTFTHCLKQEEFTPLEPDALENKFYCPGVGIVKELDVKGGTVNTGLTTIINP